MVIHPWLDKTAERRARSGVGFLVSGVLLGRPLMPLWGAYLLVLAIPAGYFVMARHYAPWREGEPVSSTASAAAVGVIEITTLGWIWTALAMLYPGKGVRIGSAAAMAALFYPLYRLGRPLLESDLYGGWYRQDRFLNSFAAALAEEEKEEGIWRRAVRMLAEGMKIERVCGQPVEDDTLCWDVKTGQVDGCLDAPALEVPVKAGKETFGTLRLSLHIERSGFERKDRQALTTVGKMVGMKLSSARLRAQVERLRTLQGETTVGSLSLPNPLTDREVEVLQLFCFKMLTFSSGV